MITVTLLVQAIASINKYCFFVFPFGKPVFKLPYLMVLAAYRSDQPRAIRIHKSAT